MALLLASLSTLSAADLTVGPQGFKKISEGVAELKAGDTLTILPGEYLESVELRKLAGTKGAPITIRAQRAGTVVDAWGCGGCGLGGGSGTRWGVCGEI